MDRSVLTLVVMALLTALLAACGGGSAELAGTEWALVSIDGAPVVPGSSPTLKFDDTALISGSAGYNSFDGGYAVDGNALSFNPLNSTAEACSDIDIMIQETAYIDALETVSSFSLQNTGLTITSSSGVQLEFAPLTE